jgi:type I restriction enzyme S subunit
VVSAYDDLIENNNRRIKLLEEMAQRIYREWFVDFRYPGHEAVPLVESELGSIPEGWCSRPLSSLAKVVMGQSPPSSAYNRDSEGKPFHQGVGTFGAHFPAHHVYSKSGARLAAKGDILMSVRAPVGRINVADRQMILGRGLSGISAQNAPFEFLLFSLRHFFREEDVMGNGSIFKSVTRRDVEDLPLPWPGDGLAQRFSDVVSPMWRHLHLLTKEQVILQSTRDLLLPRLVSGEIDVTDLDIVLAETAA